jgi:hypothetical protein
LIPDHVHVLPYRILALYPDDTFEIVRPTAESKVILENGIAAAEAVKEHREKEEA